MKDKQKIGFWFRWPVILLMLYIALPIGLILMIVRITKNNQAKQQVKWQQKIQADLQNSVAVPEDLLNKGKEIESNLEKELYCNKRALPFEILYDIKWLLLVFVPLIAFFVFFFYNLVRQSVVDGIVFTISYNIVLIPLYWYLNKRIKKVKKLNAEEAQWLRAVYQETFNVFVFSEYIERRLVSVGVIHSENDKPNHDNPECRKFYHYNTTKYHLRYKYAKHEVERVSNFYGFNFDNSIWKFGPFCYNPCANGGTSARMLFFSRKIIENNVVICGKKSKFGLRDEEKRKFKKYEMDNSHFNEKFNIYAQNSTELFKIFTPAYMEKVLKISEKTNIGCMEIGGDCVTVDFDKGFPALANAYNGFNVHQALVYAENVFQHFISFMDDISILVN